MKRKRRHWYEPSPEDLIWQGIARSFYEVASKCNFSLGVTTGIVCQKWDDKKFEEFVRVLPEMFREMAWQTRAVVKGVHRK